MRMGLKYPQHNRADKGNRQIRSHNTQPTEQWTDEYHWGTLPVSRAGDVNDEASQPFPGEKGEPC